LTGFYFSSKFDSHFYKTEILHNRFKQKEDHRQHVDYYGIYDNSVAANEPLGNELLDGENYDASIYVFYWHGEIYYLAI